MSFENEIDRLRVNDPSLTTLNLGNNNIGAAGAMVLATALHTNTTLTTLNLEYNNIGAAGATALATALHTNTTLTTLFLRANNNIGAVGARDRPPCVCMISN